MADGLEKASPRDEGLAGVRAILPIAVAAGPIAILYGALAVAKGLSVLEATLMSILVFAGGAQFAAVELLSWPVPVFALILSTLLINLRHILLAVSLTPKLRGFSTRRQLVGFFFLTDECWAISEARALQHPVTPAFWFGVCLVLFAVWVSSSLVGALAGTLLGDPARFGVDFAFTALFIGLIASFWKARHREFLLTANLLAHGRTFLTIAASAVVAALVYVTVGPPWHVLAGAFAGMLAAFLSAPSSEAVS